MTTTRMPRGLLAAGAMLLLGLLGSPSVPPVDAAEPAATPAPAAGVSPAQEPYRSRWITGTPNAPAGAPTGGQTPACSPISQFWDPPAAGSNRALQGITAGGDADVWAVGSYAAPGGTDRTLTVHWDGQAWTQVPSPNPGSTAARLEAVAEYSPQEVWAVGESGSNPAVPLAMHWTGLFWVLTPIPFLSEHDGHLRAVAVVAADDAWAAGGDPNALIEHWDGTAWHRVVDLPAGAGPLYAIEATGPDDVWAAGAQATMLHWDGVRWAQVRTPDTAAEFHAIAVAGPNDVWAVGKIYGRALMERWNGDRWSVFGDWAPWCYDQVLLGVSAAGPDNVWVSGVYQADKYGVTDNILLHCRHDGCRDVHGGYVDWDSSFGQVVAVAPDRAWLIGFEMGLLQLAHSLDPCHLPAATPTALPMAPVGTPTPPGCGPQAIYPPIHAGGAAGGDVHAVSAIRPDAVWVAGSVQDCTLPYVQGGFRDRWNGHTWEWGCCSGDNPSGVVAIDEKNIWISRTIGDRYACCRVAVSHWDGVSEKSFDGLFPPGSAILGLGRAGHRDAWVVGAYPVGTGRNSNPFAFRGTAAGLIQTDVPAVPGARATQLSGASGVSTLDVWVVGYASFDDPPTDQAVIEHWDGVGWHLVGAPQVAGAATRLFGVVALAANDAWAVGSLGPNALTMHWDGHTWEVIASPHVAALHLVAGLAPDDVWASGAELLHWDGRTWRTVEGARYAPPGSNPVTPAVQSLGGLDVVGPGDVWRFDRGVEHYTDPCAMATLCAVQFRDVPPDSPAHAGAGCLACAAVASGYADGTYRPTASSTRGQSAKLLAAAAGYRDTIAVGRQTFADVPPGHSFWLPIEQLAAHGLASGYACGGVGEPCDPVRRPYYRPAVALTRAQAAKLVAGAAAYQDAIPPGLETFTDVPPGDPFWASIERVTAHGVATGYAGGTYRPSSRVTRGEFAQLLAGAFFPACFWTGGPPV